MSNLICCACGKPIPGQTLFFQIDGKNFCNAQVCLAQKQAAEHFQKLYAVMEELDHYGPRHDVPIWPDREENDDSE